MHACLKSVMRSYAHAEIITTRSVTAACEPNLGYQHPHLARSKTDASRWFLSA